MSTVIEFTQEELNLIKDFAKESNEQTAVRFATDEFLRFVRRMELKKLPGKVQMEGVGL